MALMRPLRLLTQLTVSLELTILCLDFNCFLTVIMFTMALASSLHCTIFRHSKKYSILSKLNKFDDSVAQNYDVRLDKARNNKRLGLNFVIVWCASVFFIISFMISSAQLGPEMLLFGWQIIFLNHNIQVQGFQMMTFVKGFQNRLELLSNREVKQSGDLEILQKLLLQLYDANNEFNQCFKMVIFANFMQVYSSALINSYWLAIALLGLFDFSTF